MSKALPDLLDITDILEIPDALNITDLLKILEEQIKLREKLENLETQRKTLGAQLVQPKLDSSVSLRLGIQISKIETEILETKLELDIFRKQRNINPNEIKEAAKERQDRINEINGQAVTNLQIILATAQGINAEDYNKYLEAEEIDFNNEYKFKMDTSDWGYVSVAATVFGGLVFGPPGLALGAVAITASHIQRSKSVKNEEFEKLEEIINKAIITLSPDQRAKLMPQNIRLLLLDPVKGMEPIDLHIQIRIINPLIKIHQNLGNYYNSNINNKIRSYLEYTLCKVELINFLTLEDFMGKTSSKESHASEIKQRWLSDINNITRYFCSLCQAISNSKSNNYSEQSYHALTLIKDREVVLHKGRYKLYEDVLGEFDNKPTKNSGDITKFDQSKFHVMKESFLNLLKLTLENSIDNFIRKINQLNQLEKNEDTSIDIIAITDHPRIKYSLKNNAKIIQFSIGE